MTEFLPVFTISCIKLYEVLIDFPTCFQRDAIFGLNKIQDEKTCTHKPLYNTVHYNTVLDITWFKDGS